MTALYFLIYLLFHPRLAVGLLAIHNIDERGQVIADAKTDRIIYANKAFLDHVGRDIKELRSKPFIDFINESDSTEAIAKELKGGDTTYDFENTYIRPDGTKAVCVWRSVIHNGNYVCTVKLKR